MRSFVAAVQFLTVVPIRKAYEADEIGRGAVWFPVVGLLIGLAAAAVYGLTEAYLFPRLVAQVLGIVALAAASGGFHLDGLADSADGMLSARPRERALEIMRDSRIGTMGTLALLTVLGLKSGALVTLSHEATLHALILAPVAGRCMLVLGLARQPYARPEGGLASVFLVHRRVWQGWWALLFLVAVAATLFGWAGLAIGLAVWVVTLAFNAYCRRRIGGITGDTLGAACELAELTVLLAASAALRGTP